MIRCSTLSFLAVFVLNAASIDAQSVARPQDYAGWSVVPAFQTSGVYENNLLVASAPTTQGGFGRFTPSLETRYRGSLGFFNAEYAFDSELHERRLRALNNVLARQIGLLNFEAKPSERSLLSGRAQYITTERPEELLDPAGLIISQRRTKRFVGNIAAERTLSEASRASLAYTMTLDDFGEATELRPGARSVLHAVNTAFAARKSERTTLAVEYTGKLLVGDGRTFTTLTRGVFSAHSVGIRWTQALTPVLTADVVAGPRLAQTVPPVINATTTTPVEWERQPELVASLTYRRRDQRFTVAYGRTQTLGFGASGFVDTEGLDGRATWTVARRLQLSARPGVYRNTLATQHANTYRLEATGRYVISSWMSLDGIYSHRYQDRALALADFTVTSVDRARTRTRVAFGVTLRRPIRME